MAHSYIREVADQIRARTSDDGGHELLYLVYAVLALTKGDEVTPSDVHDAWCAVAEFEGSAASELVPFDQLPERMKRRDAPFAAAVRDTARGLQLPLGT